VIAAVADCLANRNANDGGLFATSREVGELMDSARLAVADLLGCDDADSVVFGLNMTTLTLALSRALARTWQAGDEIILTRLDHDANVSPWVLAARDAGVHVRYVDVHQADCTLRLEQFDELLTPASKGRTRLVAVGVAANAVGTINPVAAIVERAHAAGALVFLDAVHAAPHLLLDVKKWNADFLACSAYKFFGPHLGILWGRKELLAQIPAYKVRPATDSVPGKWMTGTPSFEAIAGTRAAIDYLASLGQGTAVDGRRSALIRAFAGIRQHENALTVRFLSGLAKLQTYRLWGISDVGRLEERVPTFGLTHQRHSAEELARALGDRGIFSWHGNFYALCLVEALGLEPAGLLRIGLLHYNTMDEVDRLLATLAELQ